MVAWIKQMMGYKVFITNCKAVFPAKESAQGFYIMAMLMEQISNLIHYTHWQVFCDAGLYVGEDLTLVEADECQQICKIMKVCLGMPVFPYTWF